MRLGYNTNGLAHHDALAAVQLLADIGYESVALTVDHHLLNPFDPLPGQRVALRRVLQDRGLHSVIETGARFLLDPRHKHQPTLLAERADDRLRRIDFIRYCIEVAAELRSDCVSLWSGAKPQDCSEDCGWDRLVQGLTGLVEFARDHHVCLAFEPEPGMFVDTMEKFAELGARMRPNQIELTLDVGHLHCQREWPLADQIVRWQRPLKNIHLEDMRAGIHEHLMFGEGEIDFPLVLRALRQIEYSGGVHVELSRHSHQGADAALQAWTFLTRTLTQLDSE